MLKTLFKYTRKNFSNTNQNKFEEAKKKALEMYEKIQNEQKLSKNKKVEEEFVKKRKEDSDKINFDVSDYKSDNVKNKIEDFLENYQIVQQRKKSEKDEALNLNYYNKIKDDTVYYKLNQNQKINIDKEKWVKIFEAKFDPSYEKFLNLLNKFLKIILVYGSFLLLKRIFTIWESFEKEQKILHKNVKNENLEKSSKSNSKYFSKKEIFSWFIFYSTILGIYIINVGFIKRTIYKLLVKDEKIRIFLHNFNKSQQNKNFIETDISKLVSITSKSKNLHEILYYGNNKKVQQMFAYKNAFYDKNLLVNLCHPRVKAIKFTNIDSI